MNRLIGRREEIKELERCYRSDRSEFVIVYGRRRIGKTFLVRQFTRDQYAFSYVGVRDMSTRQQLDNFAIALKQYSGSLFAPTLKDWMDAFSHLKAIVENKKGRKVIFIDEMPWMDKAKSNFVNALENFWNGWAASRNDICLIACGSATSWMTDKLIYNTGGLHNRITCRIYLRPFTLAETEEYLAAAGSKWDRLQIAQCYMAMGGVPYYLSLIRPQDSLMQNIDRLYFGKNAELREEFGELYYSLFKNANQYIDIVKLLSTRRKGMTRQEISKRLDITGSGLTRILEHLERCDFILGYAAFGGKKNNVIYRLTDFYSLFYLHFVAKDRSQDIHWWEHNMNSPQVKAWEGHTFELLCMTHSQQIKNGLGISGIATSISSWRSRSSEHNYQIDMVIDRSDRIINLCEMKFSVNRFIITKDYDLLLRDRMAWFTAETKTRKAPVITMITTYGVMPNKHAGLAQKQITLDDLFT